MNTKKPNMPKTISVAIALALIAGCTMGPNYVKPSIDTPVSFKESEGWKIAQPQDDVVRGKWWEMFNDPELNAYVEEVSHANYSLAAAAATYEQALQQVLAAEAAYYPTVTAGTSVIRSKPASNVSNTVNYTPFYNTAYRVSVSGSWVPDFWGTVKRTVESNQAAAQSSYANLEAARLSTQSLLVQNYFNLRLLDKQKTLLETSVKNNEEILAITRVAFEGGTASQADILTAETQVEQSKVQAKNLDIQRGQLEHAIAILIGRAPANFKIDSRGDYDFSHRPNMPIAMPSTLLERRPDIAASERAVAQANASIGVAEAAFYPNLSLSPTLGYQAVNFSNLLDTPARFWSIGPAISGTLFNGGLFKAQKQAAIAAYDQTVAQYKQTVLNAFQQVEDNLLAINTLKEEEGMQASMVKKSEASLSLNLKLYEGGSAAYLNVLTAQNTLISSQLNQVSSQAGQYVSFVSLMVAMGGDWQYPEQKK
jgi:NodT family efflux transporter outer membrane factor (OMF) lipoprotein